jgi:uncharacterized membrane protein (DUF4010 family)
VVETMTMLATHLVVASDSFPYPQRAASLALGLVLGLAVGLERERRNKHAGLRTFGFVGLLGGVGAALGPSYAVIGFALVGAMGVMVSIESLIRRESIELTTAAALAVVYLAGVLAGEGHVFTPTAIVLVTLALLSWKDELVGFSLGLTEAEMRSAIALAILAFVVYPALPVGSVGPYDLIEPRVAWLTVVLTAAIGFVNYILLKRYGSRGIEISGFLGGLVNSTVTSAELARRVQDSPKAAPSAFRAIMLANAAMALRNGVLVAVIGAAALPWAVVPLGLTAIVAASAVFWRRGDGTEEPEELELQSPFSVRAALQLGVIFVLLQITAGLAQRSFGDAGIIIVSIIGGFVSSATTTASTSALVARHTVTPELGGLAIALATSSSVISDVPFVHSGGKNRWLTRLTAVGLAAATLVGAGAALLQAIVFTGRS